MKLEFKIAKLEDVENIINLCNECFLENTDILYAKEMFKQTENDPNQIYLIGVLDDKVIAHCKITIIPTIYKKMNTYAILNHICVKEEYRRHNIATDMLIECEKIAREKGCVCMELWSNNFRQPAHACYKSYGFVVNDAKFFSKEVNYEDK